MLRALPVYVRAINLADILHHGIDIVTTIHRTFLRTLFTRIFSNHHIIVSYYQNTNE